VINDSYEITVLLRLQNDQYADIVAALESFIGSRVIIELPSAEPDFETGIPFQRAHYKLLS